MLETRGKPGDKVGMHSHPANVVYVLNDSKVRFTRQRLWALAKREL